MKFVFYYVFVGAIVSLYMCVHDGIEQEEDPLIILVVIGILLAFWPAVLTSPWWVGLPYRDRD
jgi:hypothetical protein